MSKKSRQGITSVTIEKVSHFLQIVGDGRLIPLVILDTAERPDLDEYIRVHEFVADGDVSTQWCLIEGRENVVALALRFKRPIELVAILQFDLDKHQGILVEKILKTGALYVQTGRPGDRIKHDFNRPKIIVEVPDTGFTVRWAELFLGYAFRKMRTEGFDRAEAKRRASLFIDEIRKIAEVRPHFGSDGTIG